MKLRVYLDTSVLSALDDDRAPERRRETEEFWARLGDFDPSTSEVTCDEIAATPNAGKRARLEALLKECRVFAVTEEMRQLADRYVRADAFAPVMLEDAVHVAAAVLTRQDVLLSWNFRHLVNRRRRAKVNDINVALGLPTIEILPPPEL